MQCAINPINLDDKDDLSKGGGGYQLVLFGSFKDAKLPSPLQRGEGKLHPEAAAGGDGGEGVGGEGGGGATTSARLAVHVGATGHA